MKLFLVAPLSNGDRTFAKAVTSVAKGPKYTSRNSFSEGTLRQELLWETERDADDNPVPEDIWVNVETIPDVAEKLDPGFEPKVIGRLRVRFTDVRLYASSKVEVAVGKAEVDDLEAKNFTTPQLERALTRAMETYFAENAPTIRRGMRVQSWHPTLRWVNRTQLLDDAEKPRDDWFMPGRDPEAIHLPQDDVGVDGSMAPGDPDIVSMETIPQDPDEGTFPRHGDAPRCSIVVGWGNNAIFSGNKLTPGPGGEFEEFRRGMVDAQVLWVLLDELGDESKKRLIALVDSHERERKRGGQYLDLVRLAYRDIARLSVLYSDVQIELQGVRQEVATNLLNVWGYDQHFELVKTRLDDIENIAKTNGELARRKYQRGVGTAAAVLSGLVVFQTGLDLVATAFSGADGTPGGEFTWMSFLEGVRWLSADLTLSIAMLLTVTVIWYLMRSERGGGV
ncbi:hypothetical protein QP932_03530 [Corynebacterium freneyi]|uniref:hypothetical protein n=1 Tax=Corynebacterium freneyi TaxID=134034 RepID=UPI00254DB35F|nr:hypothetical protein [Corynebacterium freneyi]MDK8767574.1 hypothetical protein [Corynebacterium freneyi]